MTISVIWGIYFAGMCVLGLAIMVVFEVRKRKP
jgi:hypothetical protein